MVIFRIEVTPEVFRIVESEAFLRCKTMKDVASEILAKHCSKEAIELSGKRGHILIKSDEHRDEKPKEQKIEEPECRVLGAVDSKPAKRILAKDQTALAKIKELWESGEHNQAEIARQIDYSKSMVAENIRRMIKAGILQDSKGAVEEHDIYGDQHGDVPGENRQPEND